MVSVTIEKVILEYIVYLYQTSLNLNPSVVRSEEWGLGARCREPYLERLKLMND